MNDFLSAAGRARQRDKRVDFDELGINDVVETLRDAPMDDILRSFNSDRPGEDPVIHFYEDFLKAYDKKMRAQRGVFYTPRPVVQFIVRSVHEILQTEFGIEDGLASTITWGEMRKRRPDLALPAHTTDDTPFVQVLDPATGTGTFLVEIIDLIYEHMRAKWAKRGWVTREQIKAPWNDYVRHHLLPRLHGFELMMAPYAIAHMKIGLKLAETGYAFPEDGPRVNVFLTNALEPAHAINPGLQFEAPMLAHEAAEANRAKVRLAATVVVGNPPYSGDSANQGDWIAKLMRTRLPDGADSYFRFNEADLGERNPKWVNNDYVKFMRLAQSRLAALGTGVLGYITSNSYLASPTFRGVRQSLLHTYPQLRLLDLHGNANKGEIAGGDENVFEIREGVAIAIGSLNSVIARHVGHADLTGPRQAKYNSLLADGLSLLRPFVPMGDKLQLTRSDVVGLAEYEAGWPLPTISPVNSVGIVTARDALCIHFTEQQAWNTVRDFASRSVEDAREAYSLGDDAQDWRIEWAQKDVNATGPSRKLVRSILYRPFDVRQTYYTGKASGFMVRPRPEVMRHMHGGENHALSLVRSTEIVGGYEHVFVANLLTTHHTVSIKEVNYHFPLWQYEGEVRTPNFSPSFSKAMRSALAFAATDYRPEDDTAPLNADKVFHYLYAVLHSPAYRQRYAAFLRTDFPRIPIPASRSVFDALATLGAQLVKWHLLEHPTAISITATSAPAGVTVPAFTDTDRKLLKVAEKSRGLANIEMTAEGPFGTVFINPTSGFTSVQQAVWQHTIGGYQVLHKWLDDRRKAQRSLSDDDIAHWRRVYAALEATQGLMRQIDKAITAHGGWPTSDGKAGAFSFDHPPPDVVTLAANAAARPKARRKAVPVTQTGFGFDGGPDGA